MKGYSMPLMFLVAALCAGMTTATVWLSLGGSALMAFVIYVLSGHLIMAAALGHAALRAFR